MSTLPELDAAILQQVRDLGHYPQEFKNPTTQAEEEECKLCWRIRRHHIFKLHRDTIAVLGAWKSENAYWWSESLRSAKKRMVERKQNQTHMDHEDEHVYRELCRRIDIVLSETRGSS